MARASMPARRVHSEQLNDGRLHRRRSQAERHAREHQLQRRLQHQQRQVGDCRSRGGERQHARRARSGRARGPTAAARRRSETASAIAAAPTQNASRARARGLFRQQLQHVDADDRHVAVPQRREQKAQQIQRRRCAAPPVVRAGCPPSAGARARARAASPRARTARTSTPPESISAAADPEQPVLPVDQRGQHRAHGGADGLAHQSAGLRERQRAADARGRRVGDQQRHARRHDSR